MRASKNQSQEVVRSLNEDRIGGYTIDGLPICKNSVQIRAWACHDYGVYHR
ncbi:hypothetical protein JHK85_019449 [Glycine max]|nr:hypothetical protein JHK85_019449 [Glycine max]